MPSRAWGSGGLGACSPGRFACPPPRGSPPHSEFHCGSDDDSSEDIVCLHCAWGQALGQHGMRAWAQRPPLAHTHGFTDGLEVAHLPAGAAVGLMGGTEARPASGG